MKGRLFEHVDLEGRVRTYRSLLDAVHCRPDICGPIDRTVLQAFSKVVMTAAVRHGLAGPLAGPELREIGEHEIRLRFEGLPRIKEALKAALPTSEGQA